MKHLKLDVLNHKELIEAGYNSTNYYCGLYKYQKLATNIRNFLQEWGVKFPFNPACFKHDLLYKEIFQVSKWNLPKKLWQKTIVDLVFLRDMFKIINSKGFDGALRRGLKRRAILFFLIVTFGVIPYLFFKLYSSLKNEK